MSRSEVESFQRFIFGTIDQMVQSLEGLSEAQLNWRPAARAAEFAARGTSWESVRDHWHELRTRIADTSAALPAGALDCERPHPRRGTLAGREVLLVVARHAAEHWGEAQPIGTTDSAAPSLAGPGSPTSDIADVSA